MTTDPNAPYTARAPHTSFSQLDAYKRCSLRYYFKYILKRPEHPALNLVRGKAGHAAVEYDSRFKMKNGVNVPTADLLDKFDDAFESEASALEASDLEPGEDIAKSKDMTIETLRVYSHKTGPGIKPAAVEWEFNLDLPASELYEYPIKIVNGRIDLIDESGIFDNKFPNTRRGVKNQGDVDESWQLTLYDMVLQRQLGLAVKHLGLIQFSPNSAREPADVVSTRRSAIEMEPDQRQRRQDRLEHVLRTTQKAIDAGIYMPVDDPRVCGYCPYRQECKFSLAKDDFAAIAIREKGYAA